MHCPTKWLMRIRIFAAWCLVVLLLILAVNPAFAAEFLPDYPELPLAEMRFAAYTSAFAERFGLPAPPPGSEPGGGLEAIELAIEKGDFGPPYYYCHFYLYLDSSLPIKYPEEGGAGEKNMLIAGTHFFGRSQNQWMNWSIEDRRYSSNLDGRYNRKARLASRNYLPGKRGSISDLSYREFHRELLPGLDYIKLGSPPPFVIIDYPVSDIDVWLQRRSDVDYRGRIASDPQDFLKFSVPRGVLAKLNTWGTMAREANRQIRRAGRVSSVQ